MKLSEIREAYEELSGKLSDINRQLCFAGFAVIWIFNKSEEGISIPQELYKPTFFFVLSLLLDILQYTISTFIWYFYYLNKRKEDKDENTQEVCEPEYLNILSWILFISKVALSLYGYFVLAYYLYDNCLYYGKN